MKRLYNMTQADRWKLIFLLCTILVIFISTGLMERYKLHRIHTGFSSIYTDRLIPATDIYYISDLLYEKWLLLDEVSERNMPVDHTIAEIFNKQNSSIDSLLKGYEKTYLVKAESVYLQDLKQRLDEYNLVENEVLNLLYNGTDDEALTILRKEGRPKFEAVSKTLHQLAAIQPAVGKELIMTSNADFASTNLLSYLRFGSSIIIGLVILALIRASGVVQQPKQKFNLN